MDLQNENSIKLVDYIFMSMMLLCRGFDELFSDQKRLEAEKNQWYMAFSARKITHASQIKTGLNKLIEYPYHKPPQLGEFLKWISPNHEKLGIPTVEQAYDQACRNSHPAQTEKTWAHIVVKHAWEQTGSYQLQTFPQRNSFPLFKRNYEISVQKFLDGETLGEFQKAISNDGSFVEERCSNFKKYEFSRSGVLKIYENVKTREESLDIIRNLPWKGNLGVKL